jgi:hypothetical protein
VPKVPIKDEKQYQKAIEVLTRVGDTYQGIGRDEWFLLVTEAQYQALLRAKVIARGDGRAAIYLESFPDAIVIG